jgi:hypothetical protein
VRKEKKNRERERGRVREIKRAREEALILPLLQTLYKLALFFEAAHDIGLSNAIFSST